LQTLFNSNGFFFWGHFVEIVSDKFNRVFIIQCFIFYNALHKPCLFALSFSNYRFSSEKAKTFIKKKRT